MLYLVATPLGNLADITLRALEVLKTSAYILCEDTRHSRLLLNHYEISTPLHSFHKFNEKSQEERIIADLKEGLSIALISDAGTPGISDPGADLVARCVSENLTVQAIPGPCAAIAALICSGLSTTRFQFLGFLPRKKGEIKDTLLSLLSYPGTTICYESAQRLPDVLDELHQLAPSRRLVIARELTKKFEEIVRGSPQEIVSHFKIHPLKGELVLLIEEEKQQVSPWQELTPEAHVDFLEYTYHLTRQEALKLAAEQRGIPKRDLYNRMMRKSS